MSASPTTCPACKGTTDNADEDGDCYTCKGAGTVTPEQLANYEEHQQRRRVGREAAAIIKALGGKP